ncbi:MAG: HprK-related kinase A [Rhodoferax sp.]|uniref:HprK-related kinase A n=1 Tax=Rhodoferax sp. TaxID=50421 RepID=UPI002722F1C2|nr:HprK-related kinase A [Rhodoferax sp.]MDO8450907.1 HprK-related kinase A [Rhodoferax sp.]
MTRTTVASLSRGELVRRLAHGGICLRLPPFVFRVQSSIPVVAEGIAALYSEYEWFPDGSEFSDFHVAVVKGRPFPKPLCVFEMDGMQPFTPLAAGEAFAFLEWGLNWCVTSYCHTWITVHSAVLERHGRVLIMPAPPGSGKSTLCAALLLNGWRLLSDEMALLDPATGLVTPSPRPVSLKNQSIEIIRKLAPSVVMGPVAYDTMKGNVAHMRAPADSLRRADEAALPAWVVFPRFVADAPASLEVRCKATSFMQLAENSFNQSVHGRRGFEALSDLIGRCDCYDFSYGRLDDAIAVFSKLPMPE